MKVKRCLVLGSVLAVGLLLGGGSVKAQCTGYSADPPQTPQLLAPNQVTGGPAVTFIVTADGGNSWSHRLVDTVGRQMSFQWTSWNATSLVATISDNGGAPQPFPQISGLSGSLGWTPYAAEVGHTYLITVIASDSSGQSTQDRIKWTVASGPNGQLLDQDGIPTNGYLVFTSTFRGTKSMLDACVECQNEPQKCINAHHTPQQKLTITNNTSGETQGSADWVVGPQISSTALFTYGNTVVISVLPGDQGTIGIDDQILCTFGGIIFESNDTWNRFTLNWEWAWTKVATRPSTCTLLPQGGSQCQVTWAPTCSDGTIQGLPNSKPPDLQPLSIYSKLVTNPALMPPFWWMFGLGFQVSYQGTPVTPWIFPASDFVASTKKDYWLLKFLAGAFTSNGDIAVCTNHALGTSPVVWPPFEP